VFNEEAAKKMLEKKLGKKPEYIETTGPKPFGNGYFFKFVIKKNDGKEAYFVHDTGAVTPAPLN